MYHLKFAKGMNVIPERVRFCPYACQFVKHFDKS
jgi:hypothetical protein